MLIRANQFIVVLDACVSVPMPVCDTLLRLAEEPAFYIPKWSNQILAEVATTMEKLGRSHTQAQRRLAAMQEAFPDALVTGYEQLIPAMTNHPEDRHVLAAAVRCGAHSIITDNAKDFPQEALEPFGVSRLTPDDFLVHQYRFNPGLVLDVVERQATAIHRDPRNLVALLSPQVPRFSELLRGKPAGSSTRV